jgi:nucleotide-binding universal stress UspA family protein
MHRRILVPLDGSPLATTVIPIAGAIAKQSAGEVRLIHVVNVPAALANPESQAGDHTWAERYLGDTARLSSLTGVTVSTAVREGSIPEELCGEAAEWPADLVVMTTNGRGRIARAVFGSVAAEVVQSATCAVMVILPEQGGQDRLVEFSREIAAAADSVTLPAFDRCRP